MKHCRVPLLLALAASVWLAGSRPLWCQAEESETREMGRASALIDAGRTAEAEALLGALLEATPGYGPAHLQLGRIALERGEVALAREHLAIAVTRPLPRPYLGWHLLARAELLAGRAGEAAAAWEKAGALAADALERRPGNVPALRVAIAAAESRGDPWAVLETTAALVEQIPAAPAALGGAAQAALALGAVAEARCLATRAMATNPEDPALWQLLGSIELAAGQPGAAAVALRRARELGAAGANLDLMLGNALVESMAADEAIAAYRRALGEDPSVVTRIPPLALSALVEDEAADVAALLAQVLAADAENPVALMGHGRAALRAGDLTAARRDLELLARIRPEDSRAQYQLGQLYVRLGAEDLARESMARFGRLKAAEDAEWERRNGAFRQRLEAASQVASDPRGALEIYGRLAAGGLAEGADFLAAGQALIAVEDFASAAAWFERILESTPYHEPAMRGLAEAQERLGNADLAARTRRRLELVRASCRQGKAGG